MGAALPFIAVAAMGAQALGSIAAGRAQSAADKANAQVAEQNAQIAKQNAAFAGAEGEQQVGTQQLKNKQEYGQIRSAQAAGGIDVNTGSAANVQQSQATLGKLDALTIRSEAARRAYGFQTQATGFEGQASIDKAAAHNATSAGYINAATGLLKQGAEAGQSGTFDSWGSNVNSSAINSDSLNQVGPYDNSLPWRNQPTGV